MLQNNTVCFPAAYLEKTNSSALTVTLDFGVIPQRILNSNCFDWNQAGASYDPRVTYTTPNDGNFYPIFYQTRWGAFTTNISGICSLDEKMLIIPKAGYHTILVENTSKEEFTFYGLDFKPYDDVVNQIYSWKPTVVKQFLSKDNVTENKTSIPIKELFDHLANDLCIRDLGYFHLKDLQHIQDKKAYYLSRIKSNTRIYQKNPNPDYFQDGRIKKGTEYIQIDVEAVMNSLQPGQTCEISNAYVGMTDKVPTRVIVH